MLEVADDGPGLPEGVGDQIFSRFVRGNGPADLAGDSGTGLGLAIVKAVAVVHGGARRGRRSADWRGAVHGPPAARSSRRSGAPANSLALLYNRAPYVSDRTRHRPARSTPDSASSGNQSGQF